MKTLSILILSIPERRELLNRLLDTVYPQITPEIEILISLDKGNNRSTKRNQLLAASTAHYSCFVDDDDKLSPSYSASLLAALKSGPDCVGFKVKRWNDGKQSAEAELSRRYSAYTSRITPTPQGEYEYFQRPINHLCPVRTEIAQECAFRVMPDAEDFDYAMRLRPLLRTEEFVDEYLYEYHFISEPLRNEG